MYIASLQSVETESKHRLIMASLKWLVSGCLTFFLISCSTVTTYTPDGEQKTRTVEEFKIYAEGVFRRQNQASGELILLLMDIEINASQSDQYHTLIAAEERIMDACNLLNKMVVMKIENRELDIFQKYQLVDTIGVCDYVTSDIEVLLKAL